MVDIHWADDIMSLEGYAMRNSFILGAVLLLALAPAVPGTGQECGSGTAEAASIRTADRELRKNKDYEVTDIYERAHRIIYGKGGGKVSDDRVRIAVVINGDENIVVEDRVKNQIYSQLRKKFPRENFAVMKGTDVNTKLLQYAEDVYYNNREIAVTSETNYRSDHRNAGINFSTSAQMFDTDASVEASASGGRSSASGGGSGSGSTDSITMSGGISLGGQSSTMERDKVTKPSRVDVDGMPVGMQPRGLSDMRREDYVRAGRDCDYDYVFVMTFSNGKGKIATHDFILFESRTVHKNVWMRVRFVDVSTGDYLYRNDIVADGKTHNGSINGRVIERSVKKAVQEALDDLAIDY